MLTADTREMTLTLRTGLFLSTLACSILARAHANLKAIVLMLVDSGHPRDDLYTANWHFLIDTGMLHTCTGPEKRKLDTSQKLCQVLSPKSKAMDRHRYFRVATFSLPSNLLADVSTKIRIGSSFRLPMSKLSRD